MWCYCKVVVLLIKPIAFRTLSLLSPSSVLKVPNCFTESMKLMAINQAFLRTFYVRWSFLNLSCLLAVQPRLRTLGHFLIQHLISCALLWTFTDWRKGPLIFLDCLLLLVYCLTGTPATRPFWKMRLKTRQEWYQVGNGDLHHHLGQMWYCGLFLVLLNFVRVVPSCGYKRSIWKSFQGLPLINKSIIP